MSKSINQRYNMMKFLFALALLAVPTTARIRIETDENGERSVVFPTASDEEIIRMEKNTRKLNQMERKLMQAGDFDSIAQTSAAAPADGVGAFTSQDDDYSGDECEYIELVAFVEEILDFADSQSQGQKHGDTSLWFPLYDAKNLKLLGAYSESAVITHDDDECVITGIYSFGFDEGLEGGMFKDSITTQSSCASIYGAITGGTGAFECATAFQAFYEEVSSQHFVAIKLYLCQSACTSYGP